MCLSIKVNHPDLVLAEGEHLGFQWVVTHNGIGYRCGYVRLPVGHPWHGADEPNADVHGGITFSGADVPCETPGEDNAWWIGFDCAHCDDAPDYLLPVLVASFHILVGGEVRSQEYVEGECRSLCQQASEYSNTLN